MAEDSSKGKEMAAVIAQAAMSTIPTLGRVLEVYEAAAKDDKERLKSLAITIAQDVLVASVPGASAAITASVLIARVIAENPNAVRYLRSETVGELRDRFSAQYEAAQGDASKQKQAIDNSIQEALSLPKSAKAAAVIVILGACGSASWDATKYAYVQATQQEHVVEVEEAPLYQPRLHSVTGDGLRIRAEPNLGSEIIALLPKGATVVVYSESDGWAAISAYVDDELTTGWVSNEFLSPK